MKKRIDPRFGPEQLRERARRALLRGRQWVQRAEVLYREADRREAKRADDRMGPWPKEFCTACVVGKACKLHPATDGGVQP